MRRALALTALIVLVPAGCGGGGEQQRSTSAAAAIDLMLTLWPNGEAGDSVTWTLQCEPTGGDHPDPEAACAALTAVADPFGPVAAPERCAEIPGGDEAVAVLDGDYRGRMVALALHARERVQERPLGPDRAGLPDWLLGGRDTIARDVKTVLFVGAGRHQRRAILRAKELGLRVVAVDRNPDAPGLQVADVGEAVDFTDVAAVTEVARRHGVDGVLTVSADRAVPVVAAVAEALGLPGIGTETAHLMTHKIAMRRTLADAGVPQPRFAGARDMQSARAALDAVGVPAVLKPADSGGQRGIFYVESEDELDGHVHAALAESPTDEAIVESFHDGLELNGIVIARGGEAFPLTLSDRLRPPGIGFGVGWIHVYPASIYARRARRGGAGRRPRGARARAARRHRVPAADRLRRRLRARSSRSRRGSPAARWPTSSATPSASTSSRWRCARRSARRLPTSSCCRSSSSRSRSAS